MVTVYSQNVSTETINLHQKVSRESLKEALIMLARENNIPVDVEEDCYKVSNGGLLSGLLSMSDTCVVVYNSRHRKDYHSLVIELKSSYGKEVALIHLGGTSKNQKDINFGTNHYGVYNGEVSTYRAGFFSKMKANLAQQEMVEENIYYDAAYELIGSALSKAHTLDNEKSRRAQASANRQQQSQNSTYRQAPPKQSAPKQTPPRQAAHQAGSNRTTNNSQSGYQTLKPNDYGTHIASNKIVNGSYHFASSKKKK